MGLKEIVGATLLVASPFLPGCGDSTSTSQKSSKAPSQLERNIAESDKDLEEVNTEESDNGLKGVDKYLVEWNKARSQGQELIAGKGINPPSIKLISIDGASLGRSTRLFMDFSDDGQVVGRKLYEDGKEIGSWTSQRSYLGLDRFNVEKPAGSYTYHFEATDNNGNTVRTLPITLNFSGELDDRAPTVEVQSVGGEVVYDKTRLIVSTSDRGDNRGFKNVSLYEGKTLIKDFEVDSLNMYGFDIEKTSPGTHTYHVEVEDLGGHKVKSDPIKIEFNSD